MAGWGWGVSELQGPGLLATSLDWLWSCNGAGRKIGIEGFAGRVKMYCAEHVVIGTVNCSSAYVILSNVHCSAMGLRHTRHIH